MYPYFILHGRLYQLCSQVNQNLLSLSLSSLTIDLSDKGLHGVLQKVDSCGYFDRAHQSIPEDVSSAAASLRIINH